MFTEPMCRASGLQSKKEMSPFLRAIWAIILTQFCKHKNLYQPTQTSSQPTQLGSSQAPAVSIQADVHLRIYFCGLDREVRSCHRNSFMRLQNQTGMGLDGYTWTSLTPLSWSTHLWNVYFPGLLRGFSKAMGAPGMATEWGSENNVVLNLTQVAAKTRWGTYWLCGLGQGAEPLSLSFCICKKGNRDRPWRNRMKLNIVRRRSSIGPGTQETLENH